MDNAITKKKAIGLFLIAVLVVVVIMFIKIRSTSSDDNSQDPWMETKSEEIELGDLPDYEEVNDEDIGTPTEGDGDDVIDEKMHVEITNINLVFDLLTLEAIEDLQSNLSDWIDENGFADEGLIEFTIDKDSIVYDRSYPYFVLKMNNYDKKIKVRYHLDRYEYEFEFM